MDPTVERKEAKEQEGKEEEGEGEEEKEERIAKIATEPKSFGRGGRFDKLV